MEIIIEKPFSSEEIIEKTGIVPNRVWNIFMYGSRVYGTNRQDSDYDIIVVASTMQRHAENYYKIGDKLLNVHNFTPDAFKDELNRHNIMNLECLYLPEQFIIYNRQPLNLTLNRKVLIKNLLSQSANSWRGAKLSMFDGDIHRGVKGAFHAFRILIFGIQILETGRISDYSAANYLFKEIDGSNEFEWDFFKEEFLPRKKEFEDRLKNLA